MIIYIISSGKSYYHRIAAEYEKRDYVFHARFSYTVTSLNQIILLAPYFIQLMSLRITLQYNKDFK
jgi:hypothetical protein